MDGKDVLRCCEEKKGSPAAHLHYWLHLQSAFFAAPRPLGHSSLVSVVAMILLSRNGHTAWLTAPSTKFVRSSCNRVQNQWT